MELGLLDYLTGALGLDENQAVDVLCRAPVENAFVSGAQRRWWFANLAKQKAKEAKKSVSQTVAVQTVERSYPPANPVGNDTLERHQDKDGNWTPERQALHDKIIADVVKDVPAIENPVFTMMGGGPASGKSTLLRTGVVDVPKSVDWAADEINKLHLPEYAALKDTGDLRAAVYSYRESSYLTDRGMQISFAASQNTTLDGLGNRDMATLSERVGRAKQYRYPVHAVYATVSVEEAIRRNEVRAATPGPDFGRIVPEAAVREAHASVSRLVPQALAAGLFDKFELWDTENQTGGKPTLVASARGAETTVHRADLWDAFLAKGK